MMKETSLHIGGLAAALLTLMASQVVGQAPKAASQAPQLEGKRTQHPYTSKKYSPGAAFEYTVYLSKYYTPGTPLQRAADCGDGEIGRGRVNSLSATLNTAVVPPTPSARINKASREVPLHLSSCRKPYRKSFMIR